MARRGQGSSRPLSRSARPAPLRRARPSPRAVDRVLDQGSDTVLDLLDHVLNKGVVLTGDVSLGVANVDLVYLQLSSLLCASDRIAEGVSRPAGRQARRLVQRDRQPGHPGPRGQTRRLGTGARRRPK
jgi:gas vesicle structural protein